LAFPPDNISIYNQAIGELRRLEAVHIGADDVDKALSRAENHERLRIEQQLDLPIPMPPPAQQEVAD
jgi:hypothetical protein